MTDTIKTLEEIDFKEVLRFVASKCGKIANDNSFSEDTQGNAFHIGMYCRSLANVLEFGKEG